MRLRLRFLVLAALCAAIAASRASAEPGAHISWNDCAGFGQSYEAFACNTNIGIHTLVGSFSAPFQIDQFVAVEVTLRVYSNTPTLPLWWQMRGAGQCRDASAFSSADFVAGPYNCYDFWEGGAVNAMDNVAVDYYGPGTARIRIISAIPAPTTPIPADLETYVYKLIIRNTRTVGSACLGCDLPLGILVDNYKLVQPQGSPGGDLTLYYAGGPYQSVGWQCPGQWSCGDGPGGTCAWFPNCITEARPRTWGAVKSLYR